MRHAYLLLSLSAASLATPAIAARDCGALAKFTLPGHEVVIHSAREISAPAQCRVDGVIDPRTGRDGKQYGIGFAVALPANWNGRFLMQGGGGLNGSVAPPIGAQFADDKPALERGFAVASTDSGHQGAVFDAGFMADQQAAMNFLYQGVGEAVVVAKAIVARHYGKDIDHSYFVGCSTGGREAMMMSQRYPNYFDGIVAGAPAMRTSFSNLGLRHAATALNAIASQALGLLWAACTPAAHATAAKTCPAKTSLTCAPLFERIASLGANIPLASRGARGRVSRRTRG